MLTKTNNILKIVLLVIVIIFVIVISRNLIIKYPKAKESGVRIHLNMLKPPFDYLLGLSYKDSPVNTYHLNRFIKYYDYLIKNHLDEPQIQELLAFCFFYLNDKEKSIQLYQNAIKTYPDYFWNYYNLGKIYLSQQKFDLSQQYFALAYEKPIESSYQHIFNSKAYLQFIVFNKIDLPSISQQLNQGYNNAYILKESLLLANTLPQDKRDQLLKSLSCKVQLIIF